MIIEQIEHRIGRIILNRPEKRNALNAEMARGITESIHRLQHDDSVKFIQIRAEGKVFSAGADLASLKALQKASYQENLGDSEILRTMFEAIYFCTKPVMAIVQGHAIAGGCGLVTVCDFAVAQESAKFGYTEVRIGFVPALVARFVLNKVGETQAKRLLLGGDLIDAVEAERIGLITEVWKAEDFKDSVLIWEKRLLQENSGQAMQETKKWIHKLSDLSIKESLDQAMALNARARSSEDCKKGIASFLNKEKPTW